MRPPAGCIGVVCPDRLRHGRRQSLCCGRAVDRFRPSGLALQSYFRRLAFPFLDGQRKCPHKQKNNNPNNLDCQPAASQEDDSAASWLAQRRWGIGGGISAWGRKPSEYGASAEISEPLLQGSRAPPSSRARVGGGSLTRSSGVGRR